ncbi:hypothetical protein IGI37_000102 [Enterococcus sp. AZ194]|uniref:hypothetical protein n=1 Tax=Enterococcus sp. AZ194 TaxID=2774629 RepID=UPI003F26C26F
MKDMMMEIYNALKANLTIAEKVGSSRIKFYELVEPFDTSKPFIIIDALVPQQTAYFASNKVMSKQFSYQINVESENAVVTKELAKAVEDTMRNNGFGQLNGGLDTYFKETKRYVDARRYRKNTTIHDTNY